MSIKYLRLGTMSDNNYAKRVEISDSQPMAGNSKYFSILSLELPAYRLSDPDLRKGKTKND